MKAGRPVRRGPRSWEEMMVAESRVGALEVAVDGQSQPVFGRTCCSKSIQPSLFLIEIPEKNINDERNLSWLKFWVSLFPDHSPDIFHLPV